MKQSLTGRGIKLSLTNNDIINIDNMKEREEEKQSAESKVVDLKNRGENLGAEFQQVEFLRNIIRTDQT